MTQPARTSTRQPLFSRAMKVALMAEPNDIGNDEPWNRNIRRIGSRSSSPLAGQPRNRKTMPISAQSIAAHTDFTSPRAVCWIFAAAVVAAMAVPAAADASTARIARAGAYDGVWNVLFATRAGNC